MVRLVFGLLINAVALWVADFFVDGIHVVPFGTGSNDTVLTYLVVAGIFGLVNGIIGNFVRIVAFPLYILTLGLVALVINGALLLLVAAISESLGFGLVVENFGWGIIGAVVLSLCNWVLGVILRPIVKAR
ncbi:putative membrane protein [Microbacteriaceae bacterium MWH-Ta3]|nr:putative membrane protein [Microbacteriaceae bacterium MWH-Ta3]